MKQIIIIPENIEYVAIEIIDKEAQLQSCEVVSGLFEGLAILENDNVKQLFVLMSGPKDAVDVYSLKYYNIMTLVILGKDVKSMTYFTLDTEYQEVALETLKTIVIKMRAENRMVKNDPDIIDISTFKNIPDYVRKSQKTTSKIQDSNYPLQNNVNASYVKRDPEPSVIKRTKTKKPTKKALLDTITKIANIKKGVFAITLPKILGDIGIDKDGDEDEFSQSRYYT